MNFHFILIELCNFMGICVWTGSLQCLMTQCTIETVCLTPRVTMQGYKSQKCEISINHNLTSPTKQWIARQNIGNLTRTKHEVLMQPTGMIILTVSHTPPEWATCQKSWPEKWYTTYCQGPLGLPKNAFGLIWELNFQEIFTPEVAISPEASTDLRLSCKWWHWIPGEILVCFKKKKSKIHPLFHELLMDPHK